MKPNKEIKRLSPSAVTHIIGELRKLEARGKLLRKGTRTYVACPFHNERTPSCLVTTRVDTKYEIGSFRCMGCEERGGWNKLAEALGLEQVGVDSNVSKMVMEYGTEFYDRLLKERYISFSGLMESLYVKNPKPIKDDLIWRSLPGEFLNKVKACHVTDSIHGPALLLPSYMYGELVGGVRALMKDPKDKAVVKYNNSPGEWSRAKGLYPFDLCAQLLDDFEEDYGFRGLALVEGARDSLVFNCESIPTLGLLGTQSWCSGKMDNILDLDPDFCLIVMDGDKAGREAEEKIWTEMKRLVPCRKMNLSRFNKEVSAEMERDVEVDPGNAPKWVLDEVWATLHKRKGQR